MDINFSGKSLVIPNRQDIERDAVADEWEKAGGVVVRIDKFWEPPDLDDANVKVYGDQIFSLVVQRKKAIKLVSPDNYLLITLGNEWLKRSIKLTSLVEAHTLEYPVFIKPLAPKEFKSGVYNSFHELENECSGLYEYTCFFASEIVTFENEVRCFILKDRVEAISVYEGGADIESAKEFVESFLANEQNRRLLVDTYVLDVGFIQGRGWAIIEANPAWGAGLNGCDPSKAIRCIYMATRAKRSFDETIPYSLEEVEDILYDGSLEDMLKLKGLDITYDYHRFSSNKGDCMNLRVGCTICHSDGPYYLPSCLPNYLPSCIANFGYSHDFIDDYT